ncbi:hypothetical protein [Thermococcus sp. JCM 11816]|uniref:hypothetical protein n=1 Tax=Thermococcus sp. (strain JCM 11816 / KS-1) TaxID=1295125 RepID=UPI000AB26EE8
MIDSIYDALGIYLGVVGALDKSISDHVPPVIGYYRGGMIIYPRSLTVHVRIHTGVALASPVKNYPRYFSQKSFKTL